MITINKECIDNYNRYEELSTKLNSLCYHLERVNEAQRVGDSVESFQEVGISFMRTLYNNHRDIITKALNEEVERLKEELSKYVIE